MSSNTDTNNHVAKLNAQEFPKSRSPFQDSMHRLLSNRMAVVGLIIIILNILLAVFADSIAPYSFREQELSLNNAAPQWVIDLFPVMQAGQVEPPAPGGELQVRSGDYVEAGTVLVTFNSATKADTVAEINGTVYVKEGFVTQVSVIGHNATILERPQDAELIVQNNVEVAAGDVILRSNGTEITTPIGGTTIVQDDRVVIRPPDSGYVTVSDKYPLGADANGRDLLSRIIYGARVSLAVALIGPLFATAIGVTLGLIGGYFGGWVDNLIMRIVDIVYAFPSLLLIILMMAYFRGGTFNEPEMQGTLGYALYQLDLSMGGLLFIFIGISITSWVGLARLTRGQVLSVREQEYIMASEALGATRGKIMWKHVLPNILGPLIVAETLTIPSYIRTEAFLSFIGLGVNPPTPSWGQMISDGARAVSSYPNQAIFPALALFIIMFAFNFLGDGLRDAFDPRMRNN